VTAARNVKPLALRARWVLPVHAPPIANGTVVIHGQTIAAVGQGDQQYPGTMDLGAAIILPGLVNAHAHLEFSDLTRPLSYQGDNFAAWIAQVTRHRSERARADANAAPRAIARGLAESIASGVTSIGDIATEGWCLTEAVPLPVDMVAFWEVIALAADRFDLMLANVDRHANAPGGRWFPGVSPHAPYTVHPGLFARLVALAAQRGLPVAFHLAESREELQLLHSGTGPLVEYLDARGFWIADAIPAATRPLDYLRVLSQAPRSLVIHGNYLDEAEIDFVSRHAQRMSVVYCPRTHHYFGHPTHPLARLLAAGANVALGTDSRASNPDLSLLAEMRFVAQAFPQIRPEQVLALATLGGARALGLAHSVGTLQAGKLANLAVVALTKGTSDPYDALLASDAPVRGVMYRGQWIRQPG
jgi:cytosine/adenosine deaminase-related metal-dependent hydrolase